MGAVLREAITQVPELCKWLLESDYMAELFTNYTHVPNFEVASDAFSTVKEALTRHKAVVARYLDEHFDTVFSLYTGLLQSDNYVTRRQSLKVRCRARACPAGCTHGRRTIIGRSLTPVCACLCPHPLSC